MTTCFHHRDRPTGRTCTRCGRPACPDCLREAAVGAQCFECVRAAQPPVRQQVRRRLATSKALATKSIIAVNVVVFLLTISGGTGSPLGGGGGNALEGRLALYGPAVANGQWYRLVTCGFIHYGLLHILFNMVILLRFGEMLEAALGEVRFVALYLASLL